MPVNGFEPKLEKYKVKNPNNIPEWIINEAYLINEGLDKNVINKKEAEEGLLEKKEILNLMRGLVNIKYFIEEPQENLKNKKRGEVLMNLFKQEFTNKNGEKQILADYLSNNHQEVSITMSTLDDSTAEAIKFLNSKKVPVTGWVVVDDVEGYWTNPTNVESTKIKTEEIKNWVKKHNLKINTFGFDLEKPIEFMKAVAQKNIIEIIKQIKKYKKETKEQKAIYGDASVNLTKHIEQLKKEGLETEIYNMPRFVKPIFGCMNVKNADTTCEMIYTSDFPNFLQKIIAYLMKTKGTAPALGIISGKEKETPGREYIKGKLPNHLNEKDLEKNIEAILDMELNFDKRKFTLRNLYLFALNDASVALMLEKAMDKAFENKLKK